MAMGLFTLELSFFDIFIFHLIYGAKSVSCALDMNLFAFELRVQRNWTKCVLKYHVCGSRVNV